MLGIYALLFILPTPLYAWLYNMPGRDNPENAVIIHIWPGIIMLSGIIAFCTSLIISEIRNINKRND
jgi:hypothetical protein